MLSNRPDGVVIKDDLMQALNHNTTGSSEMYLNAASKSCWQARGEPVTSSKVLFSLCSAKQTKTELQASRKAQDQINQTLDNGQCASGMSYRAPSYGCKIMQLHYSYAWSSQHELDRGTERALVHVPIPVQHLHASPQPPNNSGTR